MRQFFFCADVNLYEIYTFSGFKEPVWLSYGEESDEFIKDAEDVMQLKPWSPVQDEKN